MNGWLALLCVVVSGCGSKTETGSGTGSATGSAPSSGGASASGDADEPNPSAFPPPNEPCNTAPYRPAKLRPLAGMRERQESKPRKPVRSWSASRDVASDRTALLDMVRSQMTAAEFHLIELDDMWSSGDLLGLRNGDVLFAKVLAAPGQPSGVIYKYAVLADGADKAVQITNGASLASAELDNKGNLDLVIVAPADAAVLDAKALEKLETTEDIGKHGADIGKAMDAFVSQYIAAAKVAGLAATKTSSERWTAGDVQIQFAPPMAISQKAKPPKGSRVFEVSIRRKGC